MNAVARRIRPILILGILMILTRPGLGQTQRPDSSTIQVYPLKHSVAPEVAQVLRTMYGLNPRPGGAPVAGDLRIAMDDRSNSLIVQASTSVQTEIAALLTKLDTPVPERAPGGNGLEIVPLVHINPNQDLQNALRLLYDGRDGKFTLDIERRQVILGSDRAMREQARRLIESLEETQALRQKAGAMRLRVVWLVTGLKRENAQAVPADLTEVVNELGRLGVTGLKLAAQVLVSAPQDSAFQVDGSAQLDVSAHLAISGTLAPRGSQIAIQIDLKANKGSEFATRPGGFDGNLGGGRRLSAAHGNLCNISSQITTTIGHPVVLGMTPTEGNTSVFVVQVLKSNEKLQTPGKP